MRSILTMLGIIIGVGAVIAMVSIGMGVQQKVQNSIASLAAICSSSCRDPCASGTVRLAAGSNITLTNQDAKTIAKQISA